MSDDRVTSVEIGGRTAESYLYVRPSVCSFIVKEPPNDAHTVMVFDDGFITVDETVMTFNKRPLTGIVDWFTGRTPTAVVRVGPPVGRPSRDHSTLTFTNSFKTVVFSVSGPETKTFVGDSDYFVCGNIQGSLFECLHDSFRHISTSSSLHSYYEDNTWNTGVR